ncbi:MAG: RNA polymerase sigma factor [Clostridiales bacterium]|nr:RNA polymerase sigma factor [Clostridiales bacterium]
MGKTADFEKTYSEYYAEIHRFIFTIARRDPDMTDDISQNVWQNAYSFFGTLRDVSSARAWLYSIARNEAKRYFANRGFVFFSNAQTLDDEQEGIEVVDEKESAFSELFADRDLLARLLAVLREDEQRLILLHYAYDTDLNKIADMDGINYNTLKSNFRRALEKLRKAAREMEI